VAGNSGDESLVPDLERLLSDPEPVVRGHALWALSRLMTEEKSKKMAEKHLSMETDEMVKDECLEVLK